MRPTTGVDDRNKIKRWDGSVGTAIGISGDVTNVAKIIDGASVSPQIAQFIELSFDKTHSLLGASDVAMGDSRPKVCWVGSIRTAA